jgi:hypothetical protein
MMGRKVNKKGRNSDEHFTMMVRDTMMCPAPTEWPTIPPARGPFLLRD